MLLITMNAACALESKERPTVTFEGPNGKVECLSPAKEILNKEVTAQTELVVKKIGTLVKGSAGVKIDPERVRQEVKPQVSNWEVIDFRVCSICQRGAYARGLSNLLERNSPRSERESRGKEQTRHPSKGA